MFTTYFRLGVLPMFLNVTFACIALSGDSPLPERHWSIGNHIRSLINLKRLLRVDESCVSSTSSSFGGIGAFLCRNR